VCDSERPKPLAGMQRHVPGPLVVARGKGEEREGEGEGGRNMRREGEGTNDLGG